jgi:hypothetical protein
MDAQAHACKGYEEERRLPDLMHITKPVNTISPIMTKFNDSPTTKRCCLAAIFLTDSLTQLCIRPLTTEEDLSLFCILATGVFWISLRARDTHFTYSTHLRNEAFDRECPIYSHMSTHAHTQNRSHCR